MNDDETEEQISSWLVQQTHTHACKIPPVKKNGYWHSFSNLYIYLLFIYFIFGGRWVGCDADTREYS